MISIILLQVFCRYVLNGALPWPEEAARALMIWMMAVVAGKAQFKASAVPVYEWFKENVEEGEKWFDLLSASA